MHHVVCFSGGKDSTAMLFKMLEVGRKIDRIVCVDTTKEFPAMYDHIRQVQDRIPIKIDIVKMNYDYYFSQHIKRNGLAGYGWCDHMVRWCTKLKSMATRNFLNSIGFDKRIPSSTMVSRQTNPTAQRKTQPAERISPILSSRWECRKLTVCNIATR